MTDESIITTAAALSRLTDRLRQEKLLACDLEADSLHRYQEKVSLLQFSCPGYAAIVDPLAVADLSPLAPVMADPAIRKIFHGADYDIRSLHRDFGIEVHNLFDTMVACQFLGEKELGLAAVLNKRFGVQLDKRFQKADWSKRPLSPEMIRYAQEDTSLLIGLHEQLESELRAKGRLAWVEEECAILQGVRVTVREPGPMFVRFKGASRLAPRELAVLEELLAFRDLQAQRLDRPPFKVLGGEALLELAHKRPRTASELARIRGVPERIVQRMGGELLAAVARGCALPGEQLPRFPFAPRPQRDPRVEGRLKRLKGWRERKAEEVVLAPGILANNALLENLAAQPDGAALVGLIPRQWQRQLYAEEVARVLATSA